MNSDIIKGIISLVVASIPLIILLATFLLNRSQIATKPNDNPSLRILRIKRTPVNEEKWNKIYKKSSIIYYIALLVYIIIYTIVALFILFETRNIAISIILFILYLILTNFIAMILSGSYKLTSNRAKDVRYYRFQAIECVLESDINYLFNKCQDSLKYLNYQLVEIDENEKKIEAIKLHLLKGNVFIILKLENSENSNTSYNVIIKCRVGAKRFIDGDYLKCKSINLFIDQLISKTLSENEKTKHNIEVPINSEG